MTKKVKMGKIKLPMDVRSSNDIPAFENMLSGGPMAVVLVYADWCGHCDTYKKNVWSSLKSTKGRSVNLASVHHDQLENTSLKDSKIDGYPSILVVGKDKKPAIFNSNSGVTNAMPNTNEVSTMKKLITTPVPKEVTSNTDESNFKPTFENEPIEEGTDISLPSIKASMNDNSDKPMNDRERMLLDDYRKNTNLYIPRNSNNSVINTATANTNTNLTNNTTNSLNTNLTNSTTNTNLTNSNAKTNSLNTNLTNSNAKTNSLNTNRKNNSSLTNISSVNNSAKTLTSLGNNSEPMGTNMNRPVTPEVNSNNTANFEKGTPTATETSPPLIEGDEVKNEDTDSQNLAPANSQGTTPLQLSGGRLFRRLTHKARKSHKTTKKHAKRKN